MRLIDADYMKMQVEITSGLVKIALEEGKIKEEVKAEGVDASMDLLLKLIDDQPTAELGKRLIPKKPKNIYPSIMPLGTDGLLYGECPSCKSVVLKSGKTTRRYCPCCGQTLVWEEE